jgi:hypothetical protein
MSEKYNGSFDRAKIASIVGLVCLVITNQVKPVHAQEINPEIITGSEAIGFLNDLNQAKIPEMIEQYSLQEDDHIFNLERISQHTASINNSWGIDIIIDGQRLDGEPTTDSTREVLYNRGIIGFDNKGDAWAESASGDRFFNTQMYLVPGGFVASTATHNFGEDVGTVMVNIAQTSSFDTISAEGTREAVAFSSLLQEAEIDFDGDIHRISSGDITFGYSKGAESFLRSELQFFRNNSLSGDEMIHLINSEAGEDAVINLSTVRGDSSLDTLEEKNATHATVYQFQLGEALYNENGDVSLIVSNAGDAINIMASGSSGSIGWVNIDGKTLYGIQTAATPYEDNDTSNFGTFFNFTANPSMIPRYLESIDISKRNEIIELLPGLSVEKCLDPNFFEGMNEVQKAEQTKQIKTQVQTVLLNPHDFNEDMISSGAMDVLAILNSQVSGVGVFTMLTSEAIDSLLSQL